MGQKFLDLKRLSSENYENQSSSRVIVRWNISSSIENTREIMPKTAWIHFSQVKQGPPAPLRHSHISLVREGRIIYPTVKPTWWGHRLIEESWKLCYQLSK